MASTFRRYAHLAELASDPGALTAKMLGPHRGPSAGDGRGPGQPWAGIVEETPALWVTWFVTAAKRLDAHLPLHLQVNGRPLRMASVPLTFGPRWYWLCPLCGRRCEAIYVTRRASGCRLCMRLGYKSQAQRATSIWGALDLIFDRDGPPARYAARGDVIGGIAGELRQGLEAEIRAMLARVTVLADQAPAGDPEGVTDG